MAWKGPKFFSKPKKSSISKKALGFQISSRILKKHYERARYVNLHDERSYRILFTSCYTPIIHVQAHIADMRAFLYCMIFLSSTLERYVPLETEPRLSPFRRRSKERPKATAEGSTGRERHCHKGTAQGGSHWSGGDNRYHVRI